jgi:hypothetical protein
MVEIRCLKLMECRRGTLCDYAEDIKRIILNLTGSL